MKGEERREKEEVPPLRQAQGERKNSRSHRLYNQIATQVCIPTETVGTRETKRHSCGGRNPYVINNVSRRPSKDKSTYFVRGEPVEPY